MGLMSVWVPTKSHVSSAEVPKSSAKTAPVGPAKASLKAPKVESDRFESGAGNRVQGRTGPGEGVTTGGIKIRGTGSAASGDAVAKHIRAQLDGAVHASKTAGSKTQIHRKGGRVTVFTGYGDDKVRVQNHKNGGLRVTVNGAHHDFSAKESQDLNIRTEEGHDTVKVDADVKQRIPRIRR